MFIIISIIFTDYFKENILKSILYITNNEEPSKSSISGFSPFL